MLKPLMLNKKQVLTTKGSVPRLRQISLPLGRMPLRMLHSGRLQGQLFKEQSKLI